MFNAIKVSCKVLGKPTRVNVTLKCTGCTNSFKSYTVMTDDPVIILNLPAGNYTVEVIAVNFNITTVEEIVVSGNVTIDIPTMSPGK